METDELKNRLAQILAEEEREDLVDWQWVGTQSHVLLGELQMPIPLIVEEYLRGFERRRQDEMIGRAQRTELLQFLRSRAEPSA